MEKQFVDGLRAFKPNEKSPDFIKANVVIHTADLVKWLESQPDKIKIDMKESQKGSWYFEVNTWKPTSEPLVPKTEMPTKDELLEDVPF